MDRLSSKRRGGKPYQPRPVPQVRQSYNRSIAEFEMMTHELYDGIPAFGREGIGGVSGGWWGPYRGLMAIPSVNRCVKLVSNALGGAPTTVFRDVDGGSQPAVQVFPTPAFVADPSSGVDTPVVTMSSWALDFLLGGDAIGIMAGENSDGSPTGWFPVAANLVQVAYVNGSTGTTFTNVYDSVNNGYPDSVIYRVGSLIIPSERVLHVKNSNGPGSLRGAGVLETALGTLKLARDLDQSAQELTRNGVPTGVLSANNPDITLDQLTSAKREWIRKQSIGTVAALAPGVTFTPLSWNPEERQLMEARKYSDVQIAQLFGVPLGFLSQGVGGLTYSTPTLDSKSFLQWCMNDIFERFEQAISAHLPRGTRMKFDRDAIIVQDPAEQMAWLTSGLGAGIILKSEARTFLGLPPIDDIDAPPAPPVIVAPVSDDSNEGEVVTDNATEDLPAPGAGGVSGSAGQFQGDPQSNASDGVSV